MTFDAPYYARLISALPKWRGKVLDIGAPLTTDPEKFIFHLKYYVDNRPADGDDLGFNADYTKFRVYGLQPIYYPADFWPPPPAKVARPTVQRTQRRDGGNLTLF